MTTGRLVRYLPPASTRRTIGIFGGSFDPAHRGHLHVARTAMKHCNLGEVWWVPARGNPLKEGTRASFDIRVEDLTALIGHAPRMRISTFEQDEGITYTIDLIQALKRARPNQHFVWIMGSDSLASFHRWQSWEMIADLIPIAVIARPGSTRSALNSVFAKRYRKARLEALDARLLAHARAPKWVFLNTPLQDISSTAIMTENVT